MIDWTCLSVNNKKERRSYRVKKQPKPKYSLLRTRKSREREKTEGKKKGVSNNSLGIDGRFFQLIISYRKEDAMIQNLR